MQDSFMVSKRADDAVRSGVLHWLMQRVTAVLLLPLPFWMVIFIKHLTHSSHEQITGWLYTPLNVAYLALSVPAIAYHTLLGIETILDDYVHHELYKVTIMRVVKLSLLLLLLAILVAVWH